MKAIQITEFGGPDVMRYVEIADPVMRDGDVMLDVTAIGINYADTHQTEDSYLSKQKLPLVPGIEVVGTYDGKRFLAFVGAGGYAQKAAVNKDSLIPIPQQVNDGEALAMAVQGSTAFHILKTVGHIKSGECVVVHAGAGGVGSLAIQLAKLWGARVIAVTSSDEKKKLCLELGADVVVDANEEDLTKAVMAANNGKPVDLILEMVGGKTFDQSLNALAPFGRMVTYGMASRTAPTPIHSGSLMGTSRTITGFWLAHCFGKKELMGDVIAELFSLIAAGKLRVIVGQTFPLSKAADAHRAMLARTTTGKIVLDPSA
jgi:NADPH2:quinone reductase